MHYSLYSGGMITFDVFVGGYMARGKADIKYIRETSHPDRDFQNGQTWFDKNWKDYINFKPNSTDLSYLEQAQLSRGYFVDKVLINIEEVLKHRNLIQSREEAALAYIESLVEEEKEPTKMILYNFAYIE